MLEELEQQAAVQLERDDVRPGDAPADSSRSASASETSDSTRPSGSVTPGVSVTKISLSASSAIAVRTATSSIVRLNASPVAEKPRLEISTIAPPSSAKRIVSASTLRTSPV